MFNPQFESSEQSNESADDKDTEETEETRLNININTYRFKFSDVFTNILFNFAKIHQYDDRHSFKEAWNEWVDTNESDVNVEIIRLQKNNYKGNIHDKMYKSARHYFRKKSVLQIVQKDRKKYTTISRELREAMDSHIIDALTAGQLKPQDGFLHFCETNIGLIKDAVTLLYKYETTDPNEMHQKVKKTYKNRYSMIVAKEIKSHKHLNV